MTKGEQHFKDNILEGAFAEFYAADHTVMCNYPLRLGNAKKGSSSPTIAAKSTYILDSNIAEDDIDNERVVTRGMDIEADIVVPNDSLGNPTETTEEILDMFDLLDEYGYQPEVIIPLQHDNETTHREHYEIIRERLDETGRDIRNHRLAVGGVKDSGFSEQLQATISVREHVGEEMDIHGFGFGANWNWLVAIRRCPWLIDSFDNSSSVQQTNNGSLLRPDMETITYKMPRGTNSTVLYSMLREFQYYLVSYLISPGVRESDAPTEFREGDNCNPELADEVLASHTRRWGT